MVESRSPRDRKRACVEDTRNYTGTPVTMALLYIRNYSPTRDTYISLSMHDVVITFIIRSRSFYHGATIHTHVQIITCRVTDTPAPPPSSKSSSPPKLLRSNRGLDRSGFYFSSNLEWESISRRKFFFHDRIDF